MGCFDGKKPFPPPRGPEFLPSKNRLKPRSFSRSVTKVPVGIWVQSGPDPTASPEKFPPAAPEDRSARLLLAGGQLRRSVIPARDPGLSPRSIVPACPGGQGSAPVAAAPLLAATKTARCFVRPGPGGWSILRPRLFLSTTQLMRAWSWRPTLDTPAGPLFFSRRSKPP